MANKSSHPPTSPPTRCDDPSNRLRLFIGVTPPTPLSQELQAMGKTWQKQLPMCRWLDPKGWHLTLHFLGHLDKTYLQEVIEGMNQVADQTPPITLRPTGWGVFPDFRHPRVFWLGWGGNDLQALERLHHGLLKLPAEKMASHKSYRPHLTLGKIRKPAPIPKESWQALPLPQSPWPITRIELYQSTLTPQGAVYQIRHATPLNGTPTP
ncbi:MAG: RNA 2',3'-cyclic phosphodiesterase [Magnetococcales bacterium]|nr:RNA 2',3'-cyclic phosphodiesterase [Magnetococcales bacterium]